MQRTIEGKKCMRVKQKRQHGSHHGGRMDEEECGRTAVEERELKNRARCGGGIKGRRAQRRHK